MGEVAARVRDLTRETGWAGLFSLRSPSTSSPTITALTPISRSDEPDGVQAVLPLSASTGGSGSFLVAADDQRRYWCKPLNNLQSARVPVNEQIVGRLARLIGAAVCEPALVNLDGLIGYEFRPGRFVEPGWAHGSTAVDPALETRALEDRLADDNWPVSDDELEAVVDCAERRRPPVAARLRALVP